MIALVAIGFGTGVASGLFGVGGGFLLLPLLSLLGVPLHTSVGASLVYILGTSLSGAARHVSQGTADWRLAAPLMLSSAATAFLGSAVSVSVPEEILGLAFVGATGLALVLFNVWRPPDRTAARLAPRPGRVVRRRTLGGTEYVYSFSLAGVLATGALLGLVTGLLGIGGGFLLVPMLVALLGIPLPIAIGSSLLSILAAAAAGVAMHWTLLGLPARLVAPLVVSGVVGAQLGARLVVWLPQARLRHAYNALLLSATAYMLARAVWLASR